MARYDGIADWYDDYNLPGAELNRDPIVRLLGPGTGLCLDLGCGTGHYLDALASTGRTAIGVDSSADQLRIASRRPAAALARADAARLPFAAGTFSAVAALWISTDVDDFQAVLTEAARVLLPGGVLLFYGARPCFNGPCVEARPDGARAVHPGYRDAGWHEHSPWWGPNIRHRTGSRHVPLAELLNAFAGAGLLLDRVEEPREDQPVPFVLAVRARKPA